VVRELFGIVHSFWIRKSLTPRAARDASRAASQQSSRCDRSEQPVLLSGGPGEEVERVGRAGRGAVSERDRPQPVDCDRRAVAETQLALVYPRAAALGVRADAAVAEVPDQEVAAEDAEVGRRERQAPRRDERRVLLAAV